MSRRSESELVYGREGKFLATLLSGNHLVDSTNNGLPIPHEYARYRQEVIEQQIESLPEPYKFIVKRGSGLFDNQPKTLKEIGIEYGNAARGYPYSPGWVWPREQGALNRMDTYKLMLFLPLRDNSIGKTVWEVGYPCELEKKYPAVNIPEISMADLDLSQATYQELVDTEIITKHLIPDPILFSKYPFPQKIRFITLLPQPTRDLTDTTLVDLRQCLSVLQSKLQQGSRSNT